MFALPQPLPPPTENIARRTSYRLPPYRFVPKLHPHPNHSMNSHFCIEPDPSHQSLWDFGVDLFNQHYFWEAHEVWERLWHHLKRSLIESDVRNAHFIQGCILWSAAILVYHLGRVQIAEKMLGKAMGLIAVGYEDGCEIQFDVDVMMLLRQGTQIRMGHREVEEELWFFCSLQRVK